MEIKNVIICGAGALGLTYAYKLKDVCCLKMLADINRVDKYKKNKLYFNNQLLDLDFITPEDSLKADLIIIATKSHGLGLAIKYIKNFLSKNTKIISLINGISSEKEIKLVYPDIRVIRSYYIGHSAVRIDNKISHDGIGKIVIESDLDLERFLKKNNIDYEVSDDIIYSQWLKLGVNIVLNQLTAINECSVGELKKDDKYLLFADNLLEEVCAIAKLAETFDFCNYKKDVFKLINLVADDGKTSMCQDIIAKRKTEVDIFSGEIIHFGEKYGIKTPYNDFVYKKIKQKEKFLCKNLILFLIFFLFQTNLIFAEINPYEEVQLNYSNLNKFSIPENSQDRLERVNIRDYDDYDSELFTSDEEVFNSKTGQFFNKFVDEKIINNKITNKVNKFTK